MFCGLLGLNINPLTLSFISSLTPQLELTIDGIPKYSASSTTSPHVSEMLGSIRISLSSRLFFIFLFYFSTKNDIFFSLVFKFIL